MYSKDVCALGLVVFALSCWFSADSLDAYNCNAPVVADAPAERCQEGNYIYHMASCTTRCLSGFAPSVGTLACEFGALTPFTYTCIGNPCTFAGTAVSIANAAASPCEAGTHVSHGSSCKTQCQYGYAPSALELSCYGGVFSPSTFSCIGIPCDVPNVTYMDATPCLEGSVIDFGGRCTPNCLPGYAAPASSYECAGIVLSPPGFTCYEAPCQAPFVENGATPTCAQGGMVNHDDLCTTQCATGYVASVDSLNCSYGELIPVTFYCTPANCESPSNIAYSAAQTCKEGATVDDDSVCTAQCAPGYMPTVEALNCTLGVLDPPSFSCIPAHCEVPNVEYGISPPCLEGAIVQSGELCTTQCIFGYIGSVESLNCSYGILTPSTFRCVGAPCPSPLGIDFSLTPTCGSGVEVPHEGVCTPQCRPGRIPTVQSLACAFKILSPATYECLEAPCVAPGPGSYSCEAQKVSSAFSVNTGVTWHIGLASLDGSNAVVCFQDIDQGQVGRCGVITGDSKSVAPASMLQVHTGVTTDFQLATLSSTRVLVCYRLHHANYSTESLCDILEVSSFSGNHALSQLDGARHHFATAVWRYTAVQLALDQALVCYQEETSSKCIVLGVTVQAPNAIVLSSGSSASLAAGTLGTNRALVCFSEVQRGESGICSVLMFNAGSLTKGPDHIVAMESVADLALAQLANDQAVMCYSDWAQSEHGRCQVILAVGMQLSWTNATVIEHNIHSDYRKSAGTTRYISLAAVGSGRIVACFQLALSSQERYGYCKVLSITGSTFSEYLVEQGADLVLNANTTWNIAIAKLTMGRAVVCYSDTSQSERGNCRVLQPGTDNGNWRLLS